MKTLGSLVARVSDWKTRHLQSSLKLPNLKGYSVSAVELDREALLPLLETHHFNNSFRELRSPSVSSGHSSHTDFSELTDISEPEHDQNLESKREEATVPSAPPPTPYQSRFTEMEDLRPAFEVFREVAFSVTRCSRKVTTARVKF